MPRAEGRPAPGRRGDPGPRGRATSWRIDGREGPPGGCPGARSLLATSQNLAGVPRCVTGVSGGGETGFADGIELCRVLSPGTAGQIENRNILYSLNLRFSRNALRSERGDSARSSLTSPSRDDRLRQQLPRAVHPAVWTRDSSERCCVSPWMARASRTTKPPRATRYSEAVCKEILPVRRPATRGSRPTWSSGTTCGCCTPVSGHDPRRTADHAPHHHQGDYGLGCQGNAQGDKIPEMTV